MGVADFDDGLVEFDLVLALEVFDAVLAVEVFADLFVGFYEAIELMVQLRNIGRSTTYRLVL